MSALSVLVSVEGRKKIFHSLRDTEMGIGIWSQGLFIEFGQDINGMSVRRTAKHSVTLFYLAALTIMMKKNEPYKSRSFQCLYRYHTYL